MQDLSLLYQFLNLSWLFKKSQKDAAQTSECDREDQYYDDQIRRYANVVHEYSKIHEDQATLLANNAKAILWSAMTSSPELDNDVDLIALENDFAEKFVQQINRNAMK